LIVDREKDKGERAKVKGMKARRLGDWEGEKVGRSESQKSRR
jgi:hypothetical protein